MTDAGSRLGPDAPPAAGALPRAATNRESFVELVRGLADDLAADEGYDELAERIWTALRTERALGLHAQIVHIEQTGELPLAGCPVCGAMPGEMHARIENVSDKPEALRVSRTEEKKA